MIFCLFITESAIFSFIFISPGLVLLNLVCSLFPTSGPYVFHPFRRLLVLMHESTNNQRRFSVWGFWCFPDLQMPGSTKTPPRTFTGYSRETHQSQNAQGRSYFWLPHTLTICSVMPAR
ncbi:hypothetical protein QBC35DRAFT_503490 [Podospora australis]|uniref:Uncharacterized protein n=1 Tax=Podospora australis TaxID=1536484 RepID=A0AAN7AEF3_9PEZI|nr:hypothetical protein QBC35DRAFT_503490 [Podospora australis]